MKKFLSIILSIMMVVTMSTCNFYAAGEVDARNENIIERIEDVKPISISQDTSLKYGNVTKKELLRNRKIIEYKMKGIKKSLLGKVGAFFILTAIAIINPVRRIVLSADKAIDEGKDSEEVVEAVVNETNKISKSVVDSCNDGWGMKICTNLPKLFFALAGLILGSAFGDFEHYLDGSGEIEVIDYRLQNNI